MFTERNWGRKEEREEGKKKGEKKSFLFLDCTPNPVSTQTHLEEKKRDLSTCGSTGGRYTNQRCVDMVKQQR
jgi:hypothetical protein